MAAAAADTRLSLLRAFAVLNAEYVRVREVGADVYRLCCLEHHDTKVERFERLRRQYAGVYRVGHPMVLREKEPAPEHAFCVQAAAMIVDQNEEITAGKLFANVTRENQLADHDDEQAPPPSSAAGITDLTRKLSLLMSGFVLDDASPRAGVIGVLLSASRHARALLGLDADDSHADASMVDDKQQPAVPVLIQPGVVFCRAKHVLAPRDFDVPAEAQLAVLSERHVLVTLLAASPASLGLSDLFSFAWPRSAADDGGARMLVMRRRVYRELLSRARRIISLIEPHLLQIGTVKVELRALNSCDEARLDVLADYARVLCCPHLLYRAGTAAASGDPPMFRPDRVNIWMCVHPPSSPSGGVRTRQMLDSFDVFRVQNTFAKGVLAAGIHGATVEESVWCYIQQKQQQQQQPSVTK